MSAEPIRYFHRAKRQIETERIYGEAWLRWTYETAAGRLALRALVRRAAVSRYYGWKMSKPDSARRVLPFIIDYDLDVDEFAKKPFAYKTFNEFFARALKPAARPIAAGEGVAVLPADGRHLAIPAVEAAAGFYAKGQQFDLAALLGDAALAAEFAGGSLLISRLCPVDYHRFHFPVAGVPGEARLVKGFTWSRRAFARFFQGLVEPWSAPWLYSVSPVALRRNLGYLWENKRMVTLVESREFGRVAVCEIGATLVGSIAQAFVPGRAVARGEEKGWFKFGGSCVVTVFARGRIRFDADLTGPAAEGMEVYARMGERLGEAV